MEYRMEELLPVVGKLVEKFTSKESSSVTFETAQMLMEGVIYCIEQCFPASGTALEPAKKMPAEEAYRIGYGLAVEKVYKAKAVYDGLIVDFQDYGCRNYRETVRDGMPAFFLKYDAKFQPQNHILTLDYPSLGQHENLCGINLIYEYLCDIALEKRILECFDREAVQMLLKRTEEYHEILYMENLCSLVLLRAVGCMIAGANGAGLELSLKDIEEIRGFFKGNTKEQIENKVAVYMRIIIEKAKLAPQASHFQGLVHEYAVRIYNALEDDGLKGVFL